MTDRRHDPETRDRLASIEGRYDRYARRTTLILLAIFAVLAVGALLFTRQQWRLNDVVDQIQSERIRNTRSTCEATDSQNAAIRGFIVANVPRNRIHDPLVHAYITRSKTVFPDLNCDEKVKATIKGDRP